MTGDVSEDDVSRDRFSSKHNFKLRVAVPEICSGQKKKAHCYLRKLYTKLLPSDTHT